MMLGLHLVRSRSVSPVIITEEGADMLILVSRERKLGSESHTWGIGKLAFGRVLGKEDEMTSGY